MRQAEIVVGAEHDLPIALDLHLGSLGAGDGQEVRIEAGRLSIAGDRETPAFLEQVGVCGTVSGLQLGEVGFAPAHTPLGQCVAKAMGQASSESRTPERGARSTEAGSRSKCAARGAGKRPINTDPLAPPPMNTEFAAQGSTSIPGARAPRSTLGRTVDPQWW